MKIFTFFLMLIMLSACYQPRYKAYVGTKTESEPIDALDVTYDLRPEFQTSLADCVVVLQTTEQTPSSMGPVIARALARHMGEKVDRVIFPRKRTEMTRRAGLDLDHPNDRQHFARTSGCDYYVRAELYDLGDDYAIVFSRKHLGLKVEFRRSRDDALLWQGAHTVWRADGGLPLSPLGAIAGIAKATAFNQDRDALESMVDDALRRLMRTLPQV